MMSEMSTAARVETEINEVATATKIETNVTEVNAANRLEKLATVANSGQVKWVAGDAELFQASQQANAAARTTATGRYGFNLFRSRFLNRLLNRANLSGPIHHWNFPIKQFATQATDAENLYLLGGAKLHLELHQAIGLEGAPLKAMALAEREIQSMFNFWPSGLKLEDTWKHLSPLGPYPAR